MNRPNKKFLVSVVWDRAETHGVKGQGEPSAQLAPVKIKELHRFTGEELLACTFWFSFWVSLVAYFWFCSC